METLSVKRSRPTQVLNIPAPLQITAEQILREESEIRPLKKQKIVGSWSDDLPDDILLLIAKKVIDGSDFKSFSEVCSSWESIAKQDGKRFRPVLPQVLTGLEFRQKKDRKRCRFRSKLKRWPQLCLPEKDLVCGSHQGWIVTRKRYPDEELTLINPVSRVQFKLPFSIANRIIFCANPMDYNCYYIMADILGCLSCCKLGDVAWTAVEISGEKNASFGFADVIYYRGKLYALRLTQELFVCDDITVFPLVMTKLVNTPWYSPETVSFNWKRGGFFLVESGQELLSVRWLSTGSEVYRLDVDGLRWDRVANLGEHALFLGKSQSFSLSGLDVRGIKGNHIYHIQESERRAPEKEICDFSLEKSSVEFLPSENSRGFWFMPQLFS